MSSWDFEPILNQLFGTGSYAVVALLALALLAAWTVGVLFTRIPAPRRVVLASLRLLVALLLVAAMLRPSRVTIEERPQPATVVVMLDFSRSMTVKDVFGDKSRFESMVKAFQDASPALARLAQEKHYEVKVYAFDAEARPLEFDGSQIVIDAAPQGDQSAYGASMQDVLRREDGKRLLAFFVGGDFALQTIGSSSVLPQAAARTLAQLDCPLYTVPFGRRVGAGQIADVEVESAPDNIRVLAKSEFTVSGTVRVWGYVNRDIPLTLTYESSPGKLEPVAATTIRATRDGQQVPYELRYTPQNPGEYRFVVRADPQPNEKTIDNNEQSGFVTVIAGGLRVLYLEGEPRREQTFLRRALSSSPDMSVKHEWIRASDRNHWPLKTLDGVPIADYFQPGKFEVYILGDLDSAALSNDDWGLLKQAVLRGAGLIMLGGWHSFWPGGYQNTPLVDILPLAYDPRLESTVRQQFAPYVPPDYHLEGEQHMRPAEPLGTRHYVMQLAPPALNAEAWRKLPPLDGANRFRAIRQGAVVLAENEAGQPLLAAAEPGGRVLAFAGDSTWRWVMHGFGQQHRRFWRQVVLWLARKDELAKGNVWVQMDNRRFMPGQTIRATAGARSAEGTPVTDATYTMKLVLPDGKLRPLTPRHRDDEVQTEIREKLPPGQYYIEVVAQSPTATLGTARAGFLVYERDLEMTNSTADPALAASLAEATKKQGGRSVLPEELPRLVEELANRPVKLETKTQVRQTYYDRWYVFVALVGLMSVEWFLRKRWRLV